MGWTDGWMESERERDSDNDIYTSQPGRRIPFTYIHESHALIWKLRLLAQIRRVETSVL